MGQMLYTSRSWVLEVLKNTTMQEVGSGTKQTASALSSGNCRSKPGSAP